MRFKQIIIIYIAMVGILKAQPLSPISSLATVSNYAFTGASQTFTAPSSACTLTFVVRGAKGGGPGGGLGAAVQVTIASTPNQTFQINVGGVGIQGNASGGFNGGGTGYASIGGSSTYGSYGGGGASDVRTGGVALVNRIIVAGGGGGAGGGSSSVCGGAANCNNGATGCNTYGAGGGGGTQTAGGVGGAPWAGTPPGGSPGVFGIGGQGGVWQTASGGGGGGGYYGGGGGGNDGCCTGANGGGGGGGGSSFYPGGSLCAPANQNGPGSVTVYYACCSKPVVNESYAICTRSAPQLNTFSLSVSVTNTSVPSVLTYSWAGPNGFNSVTNSTAVATNPTSTPTVGAYINQSTVGVGPSTVTSTQILLTPNPTTLASGIYTVYTGSNGTVTACSNTVQVMVNQTPTISLFAVNAPTCQGTTLNFSLTPINPTVAVPGQTVVSYYSWLGPNSFASNLQTPSIVNSSSLNSGTYSSTAVYNYTQSLASSIFTTAPNTPLIFTSILSCQKDTSLQAVIINTAMPFSANYTLCQGSNLNLTTSATGATSYSWAGPGFSTLTQNPQLTNVLPAVSGNYTATALFVSGLLTCSQTAVSNVSVVPTSPVVVTLPNNICQNTTANNITATAAGAIGFAWTGPNGFTSILPTNSISNIQPVASGSYFATAMFAIGTVSCTTIGSNQINVVAVNPIVVTPTITVCEPSGATLLASSPGALTYSWSGPGTYTSSATNPQFSTLSPSNTGVYMVTTSYNNGILTCYNTNTTNLIVNPIITFTLPPYKQACFNSLFVQNGPIGATSYTWSGPNGFNSNVQNLQIPTIQSGQSGLYQLELNLGPCKTKSNITIDVLAPLQFTLTPQNKTICAGDSVKFIMGSAYGSGNYAYVWSPSIYLTAPTGSLQTGTPLGTTIYQVTGYDIACPDYTLTHNFTLKVNQPPLPDLKLDKNEGCEPLCLFYNSKTQAESASITYDFGGNNVMQQDSSSYCLTAPGTYHLKIRTKGTNGCSGTYVYPTPIVVFPKPHSDFTYSPEIVTTSDNIVNFKPSFRYGPVVSTSWQFLGSTVGGNDTSNVTSPTRTYDNVGKFPVMLIAKTDKGCIDTVVKFLDITDELNVYIPNTFTPNGDGLNDVFNIKGIGFKVENFSMEIFDRWGTLLYFTKDYTKGWDGVFKGLLSHDAVYVYKIKVVGANGQGKKEYVGHVTLIK